MGGTRRPRVLVVILAYNEEASLTRVTREVRASVPWADVAVVNDGSRDGTARLADELGVIALNLPHHVGVGGAEQTGLRYALRAGYDVVVRADGDGQHDPAEIPALLRALAERDADLMVGSRYLESRGYATPWPRRAGSVVLGTVISLACRRRITDPTSGFRAFGRRAIRVCADTYPRGYPEPEALVQCLRAGLRLGEVPVTMRPRFAGRSSLDALRGVHYMVRVLLAILAILLRAAPSVPDESPAPEDHTHG
jgi:glycosyltransferase involved in cell wall biosynthesis